jgi:hypothetical protein
MLALGKGSGPHAVRQRLRDLGIDADGVLVERLVDWVNRAAEAQKRSVRDEEFVKAWSELSAAQ